MIIKFKDYLAEEVTRHDIGDGSVAYSHSSGGRTTITHFVPRNKNGKTVGHDMHIMHHGGDSSPTSSDSASSMSSKHRVKHIQSVSHAVKHFLKNNKTKEIHAEPNTEKKADTYHKLLSKHGETTRNGDKIVLKPR